MNTDTIDKLSFNEVLRRLRYWEQNANPGQDRKVFNAYISELNEDGSGTDNERLFSALFPTTKVLTFESGDELLEILENMDAIPKPEHPEL